MKQKNRKKKRLRRKYVWENWIVASFLLIFFADCIHPPTHLLPAAIYIFIFIFILPPTSFLSGFQLCNVANLILIFVLQPMLSLGWQLYLHLYPTAISVICVNLYPSSGHRNLLNFLLSQFCYLLSCSFYRFCCPAIYIHLHFFCRCLIKCPTAGLLCQLCREIEPTVITSFSPALTTLLKNNIDIVITSSQIAKSLQL